MSSKNYGTNMITSTASHLVSSAGKISKIPNIWNKIINILVRSVAALLVASLLYHKVVNDSFVGKELIGFVTVMYIVWTISSYSRGQWEDHIVTFITLMITATMYYASWLSLEYIFGLGLNNPVTIGYFVILSWFSLIVIISRFTYLNVVKATGWMIGLSTVGLFVFTYSVWGTLKACEYGEIDKGIQDPFKIVAAVYLTWAVLLGLTFYAEMARQPNTKYIVFGGCSLIAAGFLGYTWQRCAPAVKEMKNVDEAEAEKIAIRDEPSWINTSAHIGTILAWFNLFIGHYISSALFAFLGYSILDQCAPKDDPRTISVNILALIYFGVGLMYVIKRFLLFEK